MKCECGCGHDVREGRRFIQGHNRRGKKHTLKAKKKLSESSRGNQNWLGLKHSDKTKRKLSKASSGENHPNWQGGISFEPYCPKFNNKFKEMIRDKFGRVCFMCGKTEDCNARKLDVHHVNYDKSCLCSDIKCEFVPLCKSCHAYTSNGDREYYEALILEKLLTTN